MKVAVLGAGYAGLTAARRLERSLPDDVDIVVVDESDAHVIRHEIHRVIRRPSFADELRIPLEEVLDRAAVRTARVTCVDPAANRVSLAGGGELSYDVAAVCLGAETHFYDLPGVEEHAIPLRELDHARAIRRRCLELVDGGGGTVVVGGAGLTGVQVAGELAELAAEQDARDEIEIVLVEQLDDVAPGFPDRFRSAVRDELAARDIDVRCATAVRGADPTAVETDGGDVPYDVLVWTGGIRGPSALGGERPEVRGTLQHGEGTFVVGDAARVIDRDGGLVPASAQSAVREGRLAAENVRRLVEHEYDGDGMFGPRLETFEFTPSAWIVSVGNGAVAKVGPSVLRGPPALAVKATAGVGYLTSVGAVRSAVRVAVEEFGGPVIDRFGGRDD